MTNASVRKFSALLTSLPKPVLDAGKAEIAKQANMIAKRMRSRVRGSSKVTGNLLRSIRVEEHATTTIRAGGDSTTENGYDYANAIEFGTQKITAEPFFWPSYRERKTAMRNAVKRAMRRELERLWKEK